MCLRSRCLAMNIYPDFAVATFGRHVTVYSPLARGINRYQDAETYEHVER
jgi:hypothetical protein